MTRGARGRANVSGVRGREVVDGPRSREVLEGGRSRQVLLGPRGRNTGGLPAALREATLFLDAKYSVAGEPRVINRGTGGSALDAKYGSVLGAYVYDGAAVLPGLAGNYLSTPDSAALSPSAAIELVAHVALDDWTPTTANVICAKDGGAGARSWRFGVQSSGGDTQLYLSISVDGTALASRFETWASGAPANGEWRWLKATWTAASGFARFYTSTDGQTWTEINTGGALVAAGIFDTSTTVDLGSRAGGGIENLAGYLDAVIVRDGIDGTTVLDVDLANVADYASTFTATTGQTVTVNSTSSDTNDPLLLTHTGENYVYQPSAASNALTFPHGSYLDFLGDMEFVARCNLSDWRNVGTGAFVNRNAGGAGWAFQHSDGYLSLNFGATSFFSTVRFANDASIDGTTWWIKATFDQDSGGGNSTARFYYAADQSTEPTNWTQLGADVVATAPVRSNAFANMAVGKFASLGAAPQDMVFYRVIIRDGIGGTEIVDFNGATDITDAGATSFTASSGQTVTVNRATSGRKTALVTRPVWLFGTDDFLEVADNALLDFALDDSLTIMGLYRVWDNIGATGVFGKKSAGATGTGWHQTQSRQIVVSDSTNQPVSPGAPATSGALRLAIGVRDTDLDVVYGNNNGVDTTTAPDITTGTLANAETFRVGRDQATNYIDMELVAIAVWRRVLAADEIAAINTYYGTGA